MAAIGLLLVAATLLFLVYDALNEKPETPSPAIQVLGIEKQDSRYVVRIRVHNRGKSTAAAMRISGTLKQDGTPVEQSEIEFQYLPGGSSRQGGMFFSHDPRALTLELSPEGYEEP